MATPFSKSKSLWNTRSISLPCRSHPTTQKIEEELIKLRAQESSVLESSSSSSSDASEAISSCLVSLSELQNRVDDLLNLPQTLQALSRRHEEKWADELLDKSVRILDICGLAREIVSQIKECVWDLQSCLRRRRKGDLQATIIISNKYNSFRKKMKLEAKRLITSLKKMDQEIWSYVSLDVDDHHFSAVIRALRESSSMANSLLQRVLVLLSVMISKTKSKPKTSKWCLVSRLVHKGAIVSQEQEHDTNKIDVLCGFGGNLKIQDTLERLRAQFEGIENGLEISFRSLIRSRSSLLNVISCH